MSKKESSIYEGAFNFSSELPSAKKVLVLAAHPDDETLGCGGTIALHKAAGAEVRSFVMADGSKVFYQGKEDIKEVRKKEALRAGEVLGIDNILFVDIPDMELERNINKVSAETFSIINEYQPDLIYAPSPVDFHPDHLMASRVALKVLKKGIKIAFYEIYMPIRFNMLIDITQVMPLKEKAMLLYVSSLLGKPSHFVRSIKGLNAYRAFLTGATEEEKFYEAFFVMDRYWKTSKLIKWLTYNL